MNLSNLSNQSYDYSAKGLEKSLRSLIEDKHRCWKYCLLIIKNYRKKVSRGFCYSNRNLTNRCMLEWCPSFSTLCVLCYINFEPVYFKINAIQLFSSFYHILLNYSLKMIGSLISNFTYFTEKLDSFLLNYTFCMNLCI